MELINKKGFVQACIEELELPSTNTPIVPNPETEKIDKVIAKDIPSYNRWFYECDINFIKENVNSFYGLLSEEEQETCLMLFVQYMKRPEDLIELITILEKQEYKITKQYNDYYKKPKSGQRDYIGDIGDNNSFAEINTKNILTKALRPQEIPINRRVCEIGYQSQLPLRINKRKYYSLIPENLKNEQEKAFESKLDPVDINAVIDQYLNEENETESNKLDKDKILLKIERSNNADKLADFSREYLTTNIVYSNFATLHVGSTALMIAAAINSPESVRILRETKEVSMVNSMGETALMIALEKENVECADLLIDYEVGFVDRNGRSALLQCLENYQIAKEKNNKKLMDIYYKFISKLLPREATITSANGVNPLILLARSGLFDLAKPIVQYFAGMAVEGNDTDLNERSYIEMVNILKTRIKELEIHFNDFLKQYSPIIINSELMRGVSTSLQKQDNIVDLIPDDLQNLNNNKIETVQNEYNLEESSGIKYSEYYEDDYILEEIINDKTNESESDGEIDRIFNKESKNTLKRKINMKKKVKRPLTISITDLLLPGESIRELTIGEKFYLKKKLMNVALHIKNYRILSKKYRDSKKSKKQTIIANYYNYIRQIVENRIKAIELELFTFYYDYIAKANTVTRMKKLASLENSLDAMEDEQYKLVLEKRINLLRKSLSKDLCAGAVNERVNELLRKKFIVTALPCSSKFSFRYKKGETALMMSVENKDYGILVPMLIYKERGMFDCDNVGALFRAVQNNRYDIACDLICECGVKSKISLAILIPTTNHDDCLYESITTKNQKSKYERDLKRIQRYKLEKQNWHEIYSKVSGIYEELMMPEQEKKVIAAKANEIASKSNDFNSALNTVLRRYNEKTSKEAEEKRKANLKAREMEITMNGQNTNIAKTIITTNSLEHLVFDEKSAFTEQTPEKKEIAKNIDVYLFKKTTSKPQGSLAYDRKTFIFDDHYAVRRVVLGPGCTILMMLSASSSEDAIFTRKYITKMDQYYEMVFKEAYEKELGMTGDSGETALMYAIAVNGFEMFKKLVQREWSLILKKDALINGILYPAGCTILHICADLNRIDMVKYLFSLSTKKEINSTEYEVDCQKIIDFRNINGDNALTFSIAKGHRKMSRLLMSLGENAMNAKPLDPRKYFTIENIEFIDIYNINLIKRKSEIISKEEIYNIKKGIYNENQDDIFENDSIIENFKDDEKKKYDKFLENNSEKKFNEINIYDNSQYDKTRWLANNSSIKEDELPIYINFNKDSTLQ